MGTTLIMITHDTNVAEHCDRILSIHDGLITDQKTQKETTTKVAE